MLGIAQGGYIPGHYSGSSTRVALPDTGEIQRLQNSQPCSAYWTFPVLLFEYIGAVGLTCWTGRGALQLKHLMRDRVFLVPPNISQSQQRLLRISKTTQNSVWWCPGTVEAHETRCWKPQVWILAPLVTRSVNLSKPLNFGLPLSLKMRWSHYAFYYIEMLCK